MTSGCTVDVSRIGERLASVERESEPCQHLWSRFTVLSPIIYQFILNPFICLSQEINRSNIFLLRLISNSMLFSNSV